MYHATTYTYVIVGETNNEVGWVLLNLLLIAFTFANFGRIYIYSTASIWYLRYFL